MYEQSTSLTQEQREARDTRRNFYADIAEKAATLAAKAPKPAVKIVTVTVRSFPPAVREEVKAKPAPAPTPVADAAHAPDTEPVPLERDLLALTTSEAGELPKLSPTIENIQRVVAALYGVSRLDLLSSVRTEKIVRPRHVAIYLCLTLTKHKMPEIGRRFGGKDHTTVLNAVRRIARLIGDRSITQAPNVVYPEVVNRALVKEIEIIKEKFSL